MIFTFVRHGETDWNKARRLMGRLDMPLNGEGVRQAEEMALELPHDHDVIFSSSLKRASQTAEIINRILNIKVIIDDSIIERDFGSLSGKTWEEMTTELGFDVRAKDKGQKYDYRPYGGESAGQVRARLAAFVDFVKKNGYKKPLVVCHGGIIRMLHVDNKREFEHIKNASINEFDL